MFLFSVRVFINLFCEFAFLLFCLCCSFCSLLYPFFLLCFSLYFFRLFSVTTWALLAILAVVHGQLRERQSWMRLWWWISAANAGIINRIVLRRRVTDPQMKDVGNQSSVKDDPVNVRSWTCTKKWQMGKREMANTCIARNRSRMNIGTLVEIVNRYDNTLYFCN